MSVSQSCPQKITDKLEKLDDITNAVSKALTDSCSGCGIINNIIDMQSLNCFPNSHTYVTYRARLEGTSETDSGSLISLIEKWVSSRPSISVTGILMTVDPECPVAISSLSEGESTPPITSSCPQSSSGGTAAIIGGFVAIIFILIIAIIIVIAIITFKLKSYGGTKKTEQ